MDIMSYHPSDYSERFLIGHSQWLSCKGHKTREKYLSDCWIVYDTRVDVGNPHDICIMLVAYLNLSSSLRPFRQHRPQQHNFSDLDQYSEFVLSIPPSCRICAATQPEKSSIDGPGVRLCAVVGGAGGTGVSFLDETNNPCNLCTIINTPI